VASHSLTYNGEPVGDIDSLPAPVLRKIIRALSAKRLSDRDPEDVKRADDDAEEERKKLSDLHAEKKGRGKSPSVEKDDLPEDTEFDLLAEGEDEDSSSDNDDSAGDVRPPKKKLA
jgi:hypothetical protein